MADQNSTACLCLNGHLRTEQAGRCGNVSLLQLWLRGTLWMELPVLQDVSDGSATLSFRDHAVAALVIASILNVLLLKHPRMTRFA